MSPEAIVREYFDRLLVQRDLTVCEEMLAPDYVDHDAPDGTPPGPRPTREFVAHLLDTYPDLQFKVLDVAAQAGSVALRATWQGTHRELGTAFHQAATILIHLDGTGRLAERWSVYRNIPLVC
jgi:hypothetical protein